LSSTMTPVERITSKLGGPEKVAEVAEVTVQRVRRWSFPEDRGGTDGRVPHKHITKIIRAAKERGIEISFDDFEGAA